MVYLPLLLKDNFFYLFKQFIPSRYFVRHNSIKLFLCSILNRFFSEQALNCKLIARTLTHFKSMSLFYTPCKHQETRAFYFYWWCREVIGLKCFKSEVLIHFSNPIKRFIFTESFISHGLFVTFRWVVFKRMACDLVMTSATIYLFKVNNRNTRKRCEIFLKLPIKTPERSHSSLYC